MRNAYLYHTKYDIEEYIPPGSHQHVGNIILAVIKELGNAPEFDDLEVFHFIYITICHSMEYICDVDTSIISGKC